MDILIITSATTIFLLFFFDLRVIHLLLRLLRAVFGPQLNSCLYFSKFKLNLSSFTIITILDLLSLLVLLVGKILIQLCLLLLLFVFDHLYLVFGAVLLGFLHCEHSIVLGFESHLLGNLFFGELFQVLFDLLILLLGHFLQDLENVLHDRGYRLRAFLRDPSKLLFRGETICIVIVCFNDLSDLNLRVVFDGQISNNVILFDKLLKLMEIFLVVLGQL